MKSPKSVILDLLRQELKANDLALIRKGFESFSEKGLKQKHSPSEKTCRQILEEYKERYVEIENAIIWIKNIYYNCNI